VKNEKAGNFSLQLRSDFAGFRVGGQEHGRVQLSETPARESIRCPAGSSAQTQGFVQEVPLPNPGPIFVYSSLDPCFRLFIPFQSFRRSSPRSGKSIRLSKPRIWCISSGRHGRVSDALQ
jgi:hypothetical protein